MREHILSLSVKGIHQSILMEWSRPKSWPLTEREHLDFLCLSMGIESIESVDDNFEMTRFWHVSIDTEIVSVSVSKDTFMCIVHSLVLSPIPQRQDEANSRGFLLFFAPKVSYAYALSYRPPLNKLAIGDD